MKLVFSLATEEDAVEIAALRTAVGEHLTARFGKGHWSGGPSVRGMRHGLRGSKILLAHRARKLVGTLRLATKKPWAIDTRYFVPVARPLYLHDMAVAPSLQRKGVGRALLEQATELARAWPAQSIRLDVYDADAGAGGFYAGCGYREVGRVTYRAVPLIYFEKLL